MLEALKSKFFSKEKNIVNVQSLLNKMYSSFQDDVGFRYPDQETKGKQYQYIDTVTRKYLKKNDNYRSSELSFNALRSWYLDNAYYELLEQKNKKKALEYFTCSASYAFMALQVNFLSSQCHHPFRVHEYSYHLVSVYMSQALLCGWEKEYLDIACFLIESIRYKDKSKDLFVEEHKGIYLDHKEVSSSVWFLSNLYCDAYNHERVFEELNEYSYFPYNDILKKWDIVDTIEIDKLTYILSEHHLEQTKELANYEYSNPNYWLFPYEILVWLKLRELKGLKNPKKFSHPLMNTPIAKIFLDLKEPLPKTKDLPYAKKLLTKLKEKCPDIEIPDWL